MKYSNKCCLYESLITPKKILFRKISRKVKYNPYKIS